MPKLYRDATTGQYTTAEDAAARPAETVAETVEARHETPDVAELRRLAEAATPGPWYLDGPWWYGDDDSAYCISTAEDAGRIAVTIAPPRYIFGGEREVRDANARFIAAANPAVVLALLDAAAERDALTVAQPCVTRMGEVYDFAWCETHDRTFALGSSCDHAGLSHVDYLDEDGRRQRGRAVLAEMEMERIASERDALAAKVERVRALPAKHPAGGWYMTSMRDVLAALDEEPQP